MCRWYFGGHHAGLPLQTFWHGQSALHSWQQCWQKSSQTRPLSCSHTYAELFMRPETSRGQPGWPYDRLYRRQALARHSLDWAQEDSALYNEVFVGHARAITRCRHCLSEFHISESCPEFQQQWGPWPPEYAMSTVPPRCYPPGPHQEACRKFNENRCFLRRCRYLHICSICSQPHPASFCAESPIRMRLPHQARERSPRQQRQEHRMLVAGKRP